MSAMSAQCHLDQCHLGEATTVPIGRPPVLTKVVWPGGGTLVSMTFSIRPALAADVATMQAIERDAGKRFADIGSSVDR